MDFKGNPFGPMPNLMATAEYVTKVHAVCTHTGKFSPIQFSKNIDENNLVILGEKEAYEPLSRAAFFKENQEKWHKKQGTKTTKERPS